MIDTYKYYQINENLLKADDFLTEDQLSREDEAMELAAYIRAGNIVSAMGW